MAKLIPVLFLTLKFRNDSVKMTSYHRPLTINFRDTLVEMDSTDTDHSFEQEQGILGLSMEPPAEKTIARQGLTLNFFDVNRMWSNRFDQGPNIVRVGLWRSSAVRDSGQITTFTSLKPMFAGVCRSLNSNLRPGGLYVSATFIGSLQQINQVAPVRLTPNAQRALNPDDNSLDHIARVTHLNWGGKP